MTKLCELIHVSKLISSIVTNWFTELERTQIKIKKFINYHFFILQMKSANDNNKISVKILYKAMNFHVVF